MNTEKKIIKDLKEVNQLVLGTAQECANLICEKLKEIHPYQRGLIMSRIHRSLFEQHFRPLLTFADERILEEAKSLKEKIDEQRPV